MDQAKRLALAYVLTPQPWTKAIRAPAERYRQPRQRALKELHATLDVPPLHLLQCNDRQGLSHLCLM